MEVPSVVVAVPAGLQLAVVGGGVTMPTIELASLSPSDERPISRTAGTPGVNAFLPSKAPVVPVVPVYPRKQARH
jgi:hypothetical protein